MKFFKCEICGRNQDGQGVYISGFVTDEAGARFRASISDVCKMCYSGLQAKSLDTEGKDKVIDLKGLWKVTPIERRRKND